MVEKELAHSPPSEYADFATFAPLREAGVTPSRQVRQGFAVEGGCGEIQ